MIIFDHDYRCVQNWDGDIGTRVSGTWDLETRDEGLRDIKYGTLGRVGRRRGTSNTGTRRRYSQTKNKLMNLLFKS